MTYFRITSRQNNGLIVRAEGRKQESYSRGIGWQRDGVMLEYFAPYDENPLYGQYEEITEAEAKKYVEAQGGDLYADAVEN